MDLLAEVLKPIPLVVWGGPALEHCGVKAFIRGYIFIVNECDRDVAEAKLLNAGFVRASWSWGSCNPTELQNFDDETKRVHENCIPQYEDIDKHSIRFAFPPIYNRIGNEPVALILPSFAGLGPPPLGDRELSQGGTQQEAELKQQNEIPQEALLREEEPLQETTLSTESKPLPRPESRLEPDNLRPGEGLHDAKTPQNTKNPLDVEQPHEKGVNDDPRFTCVEGFLYYPRLPVLLESLIRARLRTPENKFGLWVSMLEVWAIPYLWAQTMAPEDILDGIEDEKIKAWFNKETKRFESGIDRVTNTKRKGRVRSTRPLEDLDLLFKT
ncbi:hypothetical protein BKA67DRAFT_541540 [Truncatella angustata]|uniref:Uncharacterized protein n=1 Tax=Truncatella angustata TaxID=152316 RepID=A0A9P8RLF9_9PEZI|nr:uncharacterized protein BKA67DRAFT_541540 [Truncatella angustata]KAH6645311.1 hypothetical protein BKA67DRAFT_541540 [Truncatella angustata]KAH8203319.1 hypothetical protein TruAng_002515 [Truncatella angustata]